MFDSTYKNGDFVIFNNGGMGIFEKIIYKNYAPYEAKLHFWLSADRTTCSVGCTEEAEILGRADINEVRIILSAIGELGYKWDSENLSLVKNIIPKFSVGDRIVKKNSVSKLVHEIEDVMEDYYILKRGNILPFDKQGDYKLVEIKLHDFKPFDKVLTEINGEWRIDFFEKVSNQRFFRLMTHGLVDVNNVLPYEGNEKLLK